MAACERAAEVALRLSHLAARLRCAAEASRAAESRRMASVITYCIGEIDRLSVAPAPQPRVVESVIARGERALEVWRALSSF